MIVAQYFHKIYDDIIYTRHFNSQTEFKKFFESNPDFIPIVNKAKQLCYYDEESDSVRLKKDYSLDALPLPCRIEIEDQVYECTEQPEFSFDSPGTYFIKVYPPKEYMKKGFIYDYQP